MKTYVLKDERKRELKILDKTLQKVGRKELPHTAYTASYVESS
jgi:hypothetical protein